MSGGPTNAFTMDSGIRAYRWQPADGSEPTDVLSVTSIRRICGLSMNLVSWQIGNIVSLATGTRRIEWFGPRGGLNKGYVADGDFPGQFVSKLLASNGEKDKLEEVRRWLRDTADEPRDMAAVRGTLVHECIELETAVSDIDDAYIEAAIARLSQRDRKKVRSGLRPEDREFIVGAMRQYEAMRREVPYVILAREPQIWNLEAGYAGSADVLLWFLPEGEDPKQWQRLADQHEANLATIKRVGGTVVLGDYKTSEDVHTDQVVQATAYLAAEFIGADGVIDTRLTEIINAAQRGALIHIRPDKYHIHFLEFRADVLLAFLGSVAFARFLASHETPTSLFTKTIDGSAS